MMMNLSYRMRLFIALFISALILLTTILTIDYHRLKKQLLDHHETYMEQVTETVMFAMDSIDRAYNYMDQEIGIQMEEESKALQKKYKKNKDFSKWEFDELAEEIGMDIYILNDENEIIYSNVEADVGMDFEACCITLNDMLHERREDGGIFIDGIDREQETGDAKKYSYTATGDKKYLIELGFSLKNELLFQNFNFSSVTETIVDEFSKIEDVSVLNYGGKPYGEKEPKDKPKVRREAFEEVRETKEILEVEQEVQGVTYTYRYIPYESEYDTSNTQTKVVEVMYNNENMDGEIHDNFKRMLIHYFIYVLIIAAASYLLASLLAKPLRLAYYDRLTSLKNRASYDRNMAKLQKKKAVKTGMFLVDIDRFKTINASLGREKSDKLLQLIADRLSELVKDDESEVYRFGKDEFVVVMENVEESDLEYTASKLIEELDTSIKEDPNFIHLDASLSVGVATANESTQLPNLYEHAEFALMEAKQKETHHYHIYSNQES